MLSFLINLFNINFTLMASYSSTYYHSHCLLHTVVYCTRLYIFITDKKQQSEPDAELQIGVTMCSQNVLTQWSMPEEVRHPDVTK